MGCIKFLSERESFAQAKGFFFLMLIIETIPAVFLHWTIICFRADQTSEFDSVVVLQRSCGKMKEMH